MLNERSLLSQFLHFVAATVASLMVFSLYSIVDGLMVDIHVWRVIERGLSDLGAMEKKA